MPRGSQLAVPVAVLALSWLAFPGAAGAATAEATRGTSYGVPGVVTYKAEAGEQNQVTVTPIAVCVAHPAVCGFSAPSPPNWIIGGYRIADAGASITAGDNCSEAGEAPATVDCFTAGYGSGEGTPDALLSIRTGDGGDSITVVEDDDDGSGTWSGTWEYETELDGGGGADTLAGDERGLDLLRGGKGMDALDGGDGEDLLDGGTGPDLLEGGEGLDTVTYRSRKAGVRADIGGGANDGNADDGPPGARDEISLDVEAMIGGKGDDRLSGTPDREGLYGNAGDDVLNGDGAADELYGEGGNDLLDGGFGADLLRGDGSYSGPSGPDGKDTVSYADRIEDVVADLGDGGGVNDGNADDGPPTGRDQIFTDVENLRGGAGDDSLTGDARANTLIGGLGVDDLFGLAGKDRLKARDGLADGTIDCGPGRDAAWLDPLDPPPISC